MSTDMKCELTSTERRHILSWLGDSRRMDLKLLYSAARDGCDPAVFHKLCDEEKSLIMVVWSTNGWVFGGYTSLNWGQSKDGWFKDLQAFMFRIRCEEQFSPKLFMRLDSTSGIYSNKGHGPSFGSGQGYNEYQAFTERQTNTDGHFKAELQHHNYFITKHTDKEPAEACCSVYGLCNNDKNYIDCHIYHVEELDYLDIPWRKSVGEWSEQLRGTLKEEILAYKPPSELGLDKVNILLLGPVGSGKSSFCNTVNSVYKGHVTAPAPAGYVKYGLTTKFRKYGVYNRRTNDCVKIHLCDTLGLDTTQGLDISDVPYILDGSIQDEFQFNPLAPITRKTLGLKSDPTFSDCVHIAVIVLDVYDMKSLENNLLEKIKSIRSQINERGIPLVLLLTHVDGFHNETDELENIFSNPVAEGYIEYAADKFGVPISHIWPIKNYHCETELDINIDILALLALRQITRFADNYFDDQIMKFALSKPECSSTQSNNDAEKSN